MNKQYRIRKNLKYDPLFEYHPLWLKILWGICYIIFILLIGIALTKLLELTKIEFLIESKIISYLIIIIGMFLGFVINYYLMFGLFVKFGNNDPNYREKMINKRIKAENKIFIKTVKDALNEYSKSKKNK